MIEVGFLVFVGLILFLIYSFVWYHSDKIKALIAIPIRLLQAGSLELALEGSPNDLGSWCLKWLLFIVLTPVAGWLIFQIIVSAIQSTRIGDRLALCGWNIPALVVIGFVGSVVVNSGFIIAAVEYKTAPRDDSEARKKARHDLIIWFILSVALTAVFLVIGLGAIMFISAFSGCGHFSL